MKPGRHGYRQDSRERAKYEAQLAVERAMQEAHQAGFELAMAQLEREIYSAETWDDVLRAVLNMRGQAESG